MAACFWQLLALPLVAAVIGALACYLAVLLSYWPETEWRLSKGSRPGWHGIVPAQTAAMSTLLIEQALLRHDTLSEIFRELEPDRIARTLGKRMRVGIDEAVDDVMSEQDAVFWEAVPLLVKRRIYARARARLTEVMDNLIEDIAQNIEELVDLDALVLSQVSRQPGIMTRVMKALVPDLRARATRRGFWLGLGVGLLMTVGFTFYPMLWLLPLAGMLIAVLAVMYGYRPVPLYQHRQADMAEQLAECFAEDIVSLDHVMQVALQGAHADRSRAIIKRNTRTWLDSSVLRSVVQISLGPEALVSLKNVLADKVVLLTLETFASTSLRHEGEPVIARILQQRFAAMTPIAYEAFLQSAWVSRKPVLYRIGALIGLMFGSVLALALL